MTSGSTDGFVIASANTCRQIVCASRRGWQLAALSKLAYPVRPTPARTFDKLRPHINLVRLDLRATLPGCLTREFIMKSFWLLTLLLSPLFVVWTTILIASAGAADAKTDPLDWPYWRGPEYNSISRETGLPDTINPEGGSGSNLAWKRVDLGGRSTPIVLRGKLYTILRADPATPTEGERVICIDAATGKDIWQSRHNVW